MTRLVFAAYGEGKPSAKTRIDNFHSLSYQVGCRSVLATRANPPGIAKCIAYGLKYPKQIDFWLDSGAFTAWTKGVVFSAEEYATFIYKLLPSLKVFRRVFVISLDKIPGSFRQKVSKADILEATKVTLENTNYLINQGLNVVPIHHQGEPLWVMKEYLKMVEYVGISPANDSPQPRRLAYIQSLWQLFKDSSNSSNLIAPAHNFGNTSPSQLKVFPFYSADSSSWRAASEIYGSDFNIEVIKFKKVKSEYKDNIASIRGKNSPVEAAIENICKCLKFEEELKKLWQHRGIKWQEPKGINLN